MRSEPSSSWRPNQSQPTSAGSSWPVKNSWSIQAVPSTLDVIVPPQLPVSIPDPQLVQFGPGESGTGSVQSLAVQIIPAVNIRERQVCQIDVLDRPGQC